MRTRSWFAAAGCAAVVVGLGAGPALAGEVTGNQTPVPAPAHAQSWCVYSGQNHSDGPDDPGRTQSYGQIVAAGAKAQIPSPGVACNGHLTPLQGGGVPQG